MSKVNIPVEEIISQLPGAFIYKDLDLKYCAANLLIAKSFGFKSVDDMLGLNSYDIQCEVVNSAEDFIRHDRKILADMIPIKTLDIHRFSDGQIKIFLGERRLTNDKNGVVNGVLYQASEIDQGSLMQLGVSLGKINERYFTTADKKKGYRFTIENTFYTLTKRELQLLFFIVRGKTAKEISKIMKISCRTVEGYIENIKNKMKCTTKNSLIEKSICNGFLNIIPDGLINHNLSIVI
ncbi:MAG: hypothetical protein COB66_08825 [Coxiella sp. (in: Bacteria)]|nr:MAG: hypothetical protein COB66_08825 [Coxiella sp. (in: g-proteobacteria)]